MAKAVIKMSGADELMKQLSSLNSEVQFKVLDDALRAGAKPVRQRMEENAPSSQQTGSKDKQSAKVKAKFSNSKPLKDTIKSVLRKYDKGGIAIVGPSKTHGGGHGNFFASDHDRTVYWGNEVSGTRKMNRFVKDTADETRDAATQAIVKATDRGIQKAAKRTNG